MTRWKKLPPYEGAVFQGCLSCPPVEKIAPMDMIIAVGFGEASVMRGNKVVFREKPDDETYHTLQEFEDMAKKDPDHSWTVKLFGALRGRTYQRQGDNKWVLIESNQGFA